MAAASTSRTTSSSGLAHRSLSALAAGAALAVGLGLSGIGQHAANARRAKIPVEDDALFLPRAPAIRALALGHSELAADLVYLRAVLYFGTQVGGRKDFRWLDNYLQTIVDLDPRWRNPYKWAGVATMYNGTTITRERVLASSHFLRLGTERFPTDWELPFMLGCNLLFEMKAANTEEKNRYTVEGAEWIRRSALVGGAPPWAALLAATILRKEGRQDAALRHLEQVYFSTSDERTRAEVRNRLVSLKASIDFEREAESRARLEDAWHRSLPYAPMSLYLLVGDAPSPGLDWHGLVADKLMAGAAAPRVARPAP